MQEFSWQSEHSNGAEIEEICHSIFDLSYGSFNYIGKRCFAGNVASDKARRVEARFPDPLCNPYLGFAALLMAGLDGVENKIHPGEAATKDLYHLPPEEDALVPTVCHSLDQALEYLDKGRGFLTKGGVFTDSMIDAYIELKMQEVTRFRMATHPVEFDMYYSL